MFLKSLATKGKVLVFSFCLTIEQIMADAKVAEQADTIEIGFEAENKIRIKRVLNGLWQISGGHGKIVPQKAFDSMLGYVARGYTSFDGGKHIGND
jgi:hypothetical protein